jgi:hypothetical protein
MQGLHCNITNYLAFFALNFAHLARCAAAILARAAAESLWVPRLPPPDFPATLLNASIALSNFARSAFNCATTALRSAISFCFPHRGRFDCFAVPSYAEGVVPPRVEEDHHGLGKEMCGRCRLSSRKQIIAEHFDTKPHRVTSTRQPATESMRS